MLLRFSFLRRQEIFYEAVSSYLLAFATRASILSFGQMDMSKNNDKAKRPSPPASAQCKLPMAKRSASTTPARALRAEDFRRMVPFDKEWRTGANDATLS